MLYVDLGPLCLGILILVALIVSLLVGSWVKLVVAPILLWDKVWSLFECLFVILGYTPGLIFSYLISPVSNLLINLLRDLNIKSLELVEAGELEGHCVDLQRNLSITIFIQSVVRDQFVVLQPSCCVI